LYAALLQLGRHGELSALLSYVAYPSMRLFVLGQFANITSVVVFAGAFLGLAALVGGGGNRAAMVGRRDDAAAALAWMIAVVGFQVLSPITGEPRYLLPAIVALLLLFAEGLHIVRDAVSARWRQIPATVVPVSLGLIALLTLWSPMPVLITGYGNAARAIPTNGERPVRVLISSNSQGEGAFVVERLIHDPDRTSVVLRASNYLADDDWFGQNYELKVETAAAVQELLSRDNVGFVVIDDYGQPSGRAVPHHQLLHQMVAAYPKEFRLIGRFSVTVGERTIPDALLLYRREPIDSQAAAGGLRLATEALSSGARP
jgi:hypothetical protein